MTIWVLRSLPALLLVSFPGFLVRGADVLLQFSLFPPVIMTDRVNPSWLFPAKSEYCLRILNIVLDHYC